MTSLDLSVTRSSSHFPSRLTLTAEYSISSGSAFGASILAVPCSMATLGETNCTDATRHLQLGLRLLLEKCRELLGNRGPPDGLFAGRAVEIDGVGRPVIGHGLGVVLVERLRIGGGRLANGRLVRGLAGGLLAPRRARNDRAAKQTQ